MNLHFQNRIGHLAITLVATLCLPFGGCAPPATQPPSIYPGKRTLAEVIAALQQHRKSIRPIKAGGNLRLRYYDSKGKQHQENLNINLRFYPPGRIYFRGDTLLGEAIRLGANADEFWILMKPKEIRTYRWGRRSQAEICYQQQWLNPQNLLDALGMASVDTAWSLSNQGDFDILTSVNPVGKQSKRIYVDCRGYLTKKIEYFGADGRAAITLELNDYALIGDGTPVPTKISIIHYKTNTAVDITLKNVKLFEPSPKQLAGLFTRPEPKSLKQVFKLNDDCEFVEQ
jgi:hypothetical protein